MATERLNDLEFVFPQLLAINAMRDHLVHHASSSYFSTDGQKRQIANKRASRYGNAKGYLVSPETINRMTWDMYAIANHLNAHWSAAKGPFTPWQENPGDASQTAWAYNTLQPVQGWDKRPPKKSSPQP